MIKLYKRDGNRIHYWEAWKTDDGVVLHWGTLGDRGTTRHVDIPHGQSSQQVIERECGEPRSRGFAEIDLDDHSQVIVQYKTRDNWGDSDDLAKRHRVEEILNECLGWSGNGHCDGGDIGSGTINSYSFVVDPYIARESIVAALEDNGLLEGAVIAVERGDDFEVLWPKDHATDFTLF
jgi:hypothetical protein